MSGKNQTSVEKIGPLVHLANNHEVPDPVVVRILWKVIGWPTKCSNLQVLFPTEIVHYIFCLMSQVLFLFSLSTDVHITNLGQVDRLFVEITE